MYTVDYSLNEAQSTHKQLIVLDLNGTLVYREKRSGGGRVMVPRPGLDDFLDFALKNFAVMVWSSAQPASVLGMLDAGFGEYANQLVRVWDRRFCDLDGDYFDRSSSVKDLRRITNGFNLSQSPNRTAYRSYNGYTGVNTENPGQWKLEDIILIDDSESKAFLQKDNHVFISTFSGQTYDSELNTLQTYLQKYLDNKDNFPHLLDYIKQSPWLDYRKEATRTNTDEIDMSISD
ncbi:hypothetical protein LPJ53_000653 [Coemansia erecta]|uniref:Mitochondrial import inner membrane translocase subunit TIM50 n=1 Tax=Coemansia erecta TaxID=147472 RepID=A0A9W8CVR1_9FUNG|nr:hypothetical protein LPJ53_000653 [Coemansia erecta]